MGKKKADRSVAPANVKRDDVEAAVPPEAEDLALSKQDRDAVILAEEIANEDFRPPRPKTFKECQGARAKMEWLFRHPYPRLFISSFIIVCNFFIFAEDLTAHSEVEAEIPVVGHAFGLIFLKYPPSTGLIVLKVCMWVVFLIAGAVFGWKIVHDLLLRDKLGMKMFKEGRGTWFIMFFSASFFCFMAAAIYNVILPSDYVEYRLTGKLGMTNSTFMKLAACGTWLGDFITFFMVLDMMLQSTDDYPHWWPRVRRWWQAGYNRIVVFWVVFIGATATVVTAIATDFINWDNYNGHISSTEYGRTVLAAFITLMDLLIVMQDWEFPTFHTPQDINLPGVNFAHIHFTFLERFGFFNIYITGKWFNYGIIMFVIMLDTNMTKNQVLYEPLPFGQYTGPDNRVYSITDKAYLKEFCCDNATAISYEVRKGVGDLLSNSRFNDYDMSWKFTGALPFVFAVVLFGYLATSGIMKAEKLEEARRSSTNIEKDMALSDSTSGYSSEESS